jgi:hypothetical protein
MFFGLILNIPRNGYLPKTDSVRHGRREPFIMYNQSENDDNPTLPRPTDNCGYHGLAGRSASGPARRSTPCVPNAVNIFQVVDFSCRGSCFRHVLFTVVSPNSLRFRCGAVVENVGSRLPVGDAPADLICIARLDSDFADKL